MCSAKDHTAVELWHYVNNAYPHTSNGTFLTGLLDVPCTSKIADMQTRRPTGKDPTPQTRSTRILLLLLLLLSVALFDNIPRWQHGKHRIVWPFGSSFVACFGLTDGRSRQVCVNRQRQELFTFVRRSHTWHPVSYEANLVSLTEWNAFIWSGRAWVRWIFSLLLFVLLIVPFSSSRAEQILSITSHLRKNGAKR